MKAIGFAQGQFGDILMGTVAARAHKLAHPDSKLICGINKKYAAILPLLKDHEYYDGIHVWDGYDNWPTSDDSIYMATSRYDKVYNPMPQHTEPYWYLHRHQTAELCLMQGLTPPENLQVSLNTKHRHADEKKGVIALALFGETRGAEKSVSLEQGRAIAALVEKLGYIPYQIGLSTEPKICQHRLEAPFAYSAWAMASCSALISIDTAMCWIASAYSLPTVGLYSNEYYPMAHLAKTWQPVNPNAIYLESPKVTDIILDRIEAAIKTLNPCKS